MLGGGAGGLSAAVELSRAGHEVIVWNRNPKTVAPYVESGEIPYSGVLGEGVVRPTSITSDLAEAVRSAEVAVACLPSIAHGALFADLADLGTRTPLVLNPGHTGAALHARQVWGARGVTLPPLVEFSTLTYVARVIPDGIVVTTGRAGTVRAACLPGGEQALEWGVRLFPGATPISNVLGSSLANANLVLHPPGAILGLAWVEGTGGKFTFYVEGMTPGVVRVLTALDDERRAVAALFGHDLPPLLDEMAAIGTVEPEIAAAGADIGTAIRSGTANATISAPDSLQHRYYREDLPFGLLPFVSLADVVGHAVPTARALLHLGKAAVGEGAFATGLDSARLGIDGYNRTELMSAVGNMPAA